MSHTRFPCATLHSATGIRTRAAAVKARYPDQLDYNGGLHEVGLEPTKHYASQLKCDPFDHSGIHACAIIGVFLF